MTPIIRTLIVALAFLLGIELEEILTRRFLNKITEDSMELWRENTVLSIAKKNLSDKYYRQLNKTLSAEKKYLDLLKEQSPTRRNKDEIIRLHKLGRSTELIGQYFWVTGRAIRAALHKWWVK